MTNHQVNSGCMMYDVKRKNLLLFCYTKIMQRIEAKNAQNIRSYFQTAAEIANMATCQRAHCGSVIVKNDEIIGRGYNSPPLENENNRTCNVTWNYTKKPKYDKTCCIHAEWRAIINALKKNSTKVSGSRLYFMRIDEAGNFTDAGDPYCTVCSRLAMEAGIAEFALWNNEGADIYKVDEYDIQSYQYYKISTK